ncbi:MAG TPA: DNA polymerase III subunit epsilon [Pseudomonadales bacterium]|nr:DNA polymerase III subunit epsilon [Gammaproteobacteria bacterium]MDP6025903.1 DNA polymerase III subunit epsilon [Pseudomonadales bacterium]MDP7575740.1 DNA polymerase III subunit epsilon [Pseudomonadales bacterium]HJL60650.1 DNA polymerase III subunit epsilon [Pseudomonadales bacterium]HJP52551.1 DNA polymerase III subunit epsilon [Pseudomonadales bacterium]
MRQVVLDTETTGLEVEQGHRILEIGCVEIVDRRITHKHFHQYVNPERDIDDGALEVHGITRAFLADKPVFSDIWQGLFDFIGESEIIIHNAAFDVAFIDYEMSMIPSSPGRITDYCTIVDSLEIARQKHPGQKNNLDALCKRYGVDNSQRDLHGALLDAEILADVYLMLTGGQVSLSLGSGSESDNSRVSGKETRLDSNRPPLRIIRASAEEIEKHEAKLDEIDKASGGSVWRNIVRSEP